MKVSRERLQTNGPGLEPHSPVVDEWHSNRNLPTSGCAFRRFITAAQPASNRTGTVLRLGFKRDRYIMLLPCIVVAWESSPKELDPTVMGRPCCIH